VNFPEERLTRTNVSRLPNAWTYPFETIPQEEYDLIQAGLSEAQKLLHLTHINNTKITNSTSFFLW